MRVLVAEDERITRTSLARQLVKWGHEVVAAEDGQQAWDACRAGEFDLVMTDWEMPNVSGLELIKRIRSEAWASYVYILMLTGRTDKSDIVDGIEAGADDFLTKPFDNGELRVRLLAGERIVQLERRLQEQNEELREASERMRTDLLAAARVQNAMLPKSNIESEYVRTSWVYVPTDELAGDGIGFELIDDRYLVGYIADVMGHGVPAALLSVRLMHTMTSATQSAREPSSGLLGAPSKQLTRLNRQFSDDTSDGRFLTMILCVLDTVEGTLRFARAGHPLPIVIRNGELVPTGDTAGLPIGVMPGEEYDDVVMQLEPGDRVVIYSDGFMEQSAADSIEQYGEERLERLLVEGSALPGDEMVTNAVDALAAWAGGGAFGDDMSLVVLEFRGR